MDYPSWVDSPNGNCSASLAYDFLNNDNNDIKGWKWFWKKFKTFLWIIFHNKLPTNYLEARRGITISDLCPRCNSSPEKLDHLFRNCPKAASLWDKFPSGRFMKEGFENSTFDWITYNLKKSKILHVGTKIPWNIFFCTILWQIWKDRNKKSFDNVDLVPEVSSKLLCSYATEIVEAFKSPLITAPPKN